MLPSSLSIFIDELPEARERLSPTDEFSRYGLFDGCEVPVGVRIYYLLESSPALALEGRVRFASA